MKRNTFLLAAGLLLASLAGCSQGPDTKALRTGDLLFVGIPADYSLDTTSMADAIGDATQGDSPLNIIHVAILEVEGDSTFIIDATIRHNVARYPLDTFLVDFTLRDGSLPELMVKRLRGDHDFDSFIARAKQYLGQPYDVAFLPDNGAMYCSELVHDSYLGSDGKSLFSSAPMNFLDSEGNMPAYWEQLFGMLGMPVPQGIEGTNPKAMMEEEILEPVGKLTDLYFTEK